MTRFALAENVRRIAGVQQAAPQLPLFPEDRPSGATDSNELPPIAIRESTRARRLSIKVYPRGRVEVVVPRRTRPADVEQFVSENRAWIVKARQEFAGRHGFEPFALPTTIALAAIGKSVNVRYERDKALKTVRFRQSGDQLRLWGNVSDENLCVAALKRWLSSVARSEYLPRLDALSRLTGIPYERMQIRAQRTCWGSRSCSGTISLNLCLLFLRPALLRYLLVHELCHGRHMNHSRRFWALVSKFEPDCRALDRELGESWQDVPVWVGLT